MTKTDEVIVGNIGMVHSGSDAGAANRVFESYVESSKEAFGRAAGEDVTLMVDDEPCREYFGTNHENE